jgi:peptidoglycan hydrolase CwlO-like protein
MSYNGSNVDVSHNIISNARGDFVAYAQGVVQLQSNENSSIVAQSDDIIFTNPNFKVTLTEIVNKLRKLEEDVAALNERVTRVEAVANNALQTAQAAQATANSALSIAQTAQATAANAQATANSAIALANAAISAAQSAGAAAGSAGGTAGSAVGQVAVLQQQLLGVQMAMNSLAMHIHYIDGKPTSTPYN